MDVLSDVIGAVRLTGSVFLDARFTEPWSVVSHVGPDDFPDRRDMPAHIIAYHYVVKGCMYVQVDAAPARQVCAGGVVLLPRNHPHVLASAPGLPAVWIDHLIQAPTHTSPALLSYGGGGEPTHIVCGFMGCNAPHNPLIATLPPVLVLQLQAGEESEWLTRSFSLFADAFVSGGIGSAAVLAKLAELLFVEAIRRYLASTPGQGTGWLAGLQDRIVGRALCLMHEHEHRAWTTGELAREVGLSRSAFAERFTTIVGMPPMRYLANWRLQQAAQRLRESAASTAQIADGVGYASDAAFNRAFKRAFGVTPAVWRRHGTGWDLH